MDISYKTIAEWVEDYNYYNIKEKEGLSLEEYLEECECDYHRNAEMDSYFYEIDPIQSYMDGYMESHRREY